MTYFLSALDGVITPSERLVTISTYEADCQLTQISIPMQSTQLHFGPAQRETICAVHSDAETPGIYILVFLNEAETGRSTEVYVGSSGNPVGRLLSHERLRDADLVYIVTNASDTFNVSHARLAEGVLQRLAAGQKHVTLVGQKTSVFAVGAYDTHVCSCFLNHAVALLATAGFPFRRCDRLALENVPFLDENYYRDAAQEDIQKAPAASDVGATYEFVGGGVLSDFVLKGTQLGFEKFVISQGSHFRVGDFHQPKARYRESRLLEANGLLDESGFEDGRLILNTPFVVRSPGDAAWTMLKAAPSAQRSWRVHASAGTDSEPSASIVPFRTANA